MNTRISSSNIKEKVKSNSIMFKIILSYLLITLILFLLFPVILIRNFSNSYIEKVTASYEELMNHSYSISNLLISSIYTDFLSKSNYDPLFTKGLYGNNFSDEDIFNICTTLEKETSESSILSSIYIINFKEDRVFYNNPGISKINNFFDQNIVNILKSNTKYKNESFISREVNNDTIVSIIYNIYESNDTLLSSLVLNLDSSILRDIFLNKENTFFNGYIINNEGNILLSSNNEANTLSTDDIFNLILSNDKKNDSFITTIDNNNEYLILYIKSPAIGWNFVTLVDMNYLFDSLFSTKKSTVILTLLFVIFSIMCMYFYMKHIYNPFYKLINNLKSKTSDSNLIKLNEYDYLKNLIENLNNKDILTQNELKNNLIFKLISQNFYLTDALSNQILSCGIPINNPYYITLVISVDSFDDIKLKYSENDLCLLEYALLNIIHEILSESFSLDLIVDKTNDIITIIYLPNNTNEEIKKLNDLVITIHDVVNKFLNLTLTSCTGSIVNNINLIKDSYYEAINLSKYKILFGNNSIINYDTFKKRDYKTIEYPIEIEKEILLAIRNKNIDNLQTNLKEFFLHLSQTSYSEIQMYIGQFIISIDKSLKNSNKNNISQLNFDFNDIYINCTKLDSLSEIEDFILKTLINILENLKTTKAAKNEKLTEVIKEFISENYYNQNLSVELIADYVNLSPNYIRSIFKEIELTSITNYINEFKINKAKELLITTDHTAKKIASLVGFNDSRYFYAVFKKYTSMTTEEFRKQNKCEISLKIINTV